MQVWITTQLTRGTEPRTIQGVRPKPSAPPTVYKRAFVQRVRAARLGIGKSPAEMCKLLDVPKDTYHRYETRTLLPHHLIELFCQLTGKDIEWMLTGVPRLQVVPSQGITAQGGPGTAGDTAERMIL